MRGDNFWWGYATGVRLLSAVVVGLSWAQDRADPGMAYGDPTPEDCDGTLSCFDCDGNYICGNDMTEQDACLSRRHGEWEWTWGECYLTVEWLDGYAILTLTTEADIWQTIRIREDIQLGLRSDGIVVWRKHEED
jgi:hypothetical protein